MAGLKDIICKESHLVKNKGPVYEVIVETPCTNSVEVLFYLDTWYDRDFEMVVLKIQTLHDQNQCLFLVL